MSYNVAHYNHDSATLLPDKYRFNFKKMLSDINPDIIATQEDQNYINSAETMTAAAYIYKPVYPYQAGTFATNLYSKRIPVSSYTTITTSTERTLRSALYNVPNNKKLFIISVHSAVRADPSDTTIDPVGPESIAKRLEEYTEYFKWAYREVTMKDFSSGNQIEAPEWDYCIVSGDFNALTAEDKANLKALASARNFTLANGGWLGWLETARNAAGTDRNAIDNIICSQGIIINSITSHKELYYDLYSDHYPFETTLTLL
jgi:endonuclease/exonuclease/phosphatase family metal-dependent hydrolase